MTSTSPALHVGQADSTHVVAKVWPDLTTAEVSALFADYPGLDGPYALGAPSRRPLSAATTVTTRDRTVFVKRHSRAVRDSRDLGREHAFIGHLAGAGVATPEPLVDRSGSTASERVWDGREWTYEVFPLAVGEDRYRGRDTWTPFLSRADAHGSGRALATLHLAARGFTATARPAGVLRSRPRVFAAGDDPLAELRRLGEELPSLGDFLATHDVRRDLQPHLKFHDALRPLWRQLESSWTHNDWHASNQFFVEHAVSSVIDFGLSDRTTPVYDLAIALERNTLRWPELLAGDDTAFHLDQSAAFLSGYREIRPLTEVECRALLAALPLAQADAALSALVYYHEVLAEPAMARWGYDSMLVDHTVWFLTPAGRRYLAGVAQVLQR